MSDKKKEKLVCVRCGFVTDDSDNYCIDCGAPLKNKCTKKASPLHGGCSKLNKPEAKYCAACGEKTTFHVWGLL
ncbi:hypothetical protein B5M42_000560 [Paenibacillus athensensis]|uniref:DZANK-type domain-containing protein n=1 Tax=Paenibacillus athensensis TaxID=1967502 RepID=A0A4Y8Q793_9BACL|nr:zinc ribbon domain-containing protein [Paenibacillus athensensis]MCD1257325.1 hypothetical protein [Paenibacillus athensensis]